MAINLSDAEPQRDFGTSIPDGTYCKVKLAIKPGAYSLPNMDAADNGLFRQARAPSDAVMLDSELTVMPPSPHQKRKIFQMWTINGGKLDEKGQSIAWNITKSALRAMIDSACGLDPADTSSAAMAIRQLPSFKSLDGIEFYARISVESDPEGRYADQNRIGHIVVPGELEYAELAAGRIPEPRPARGGGKRSAGTVATSGPVAQKLAAWQQSAPAAPVVASTAAAQPAPAGQSSGPKWLQK